MEGWRWGAAMAGAGFVLLLVLQVALPLPLDDAQLAERIASDGPLPTAGLRVALGPATLAGYHAPSDTTLAMFGRCDGAPCGPVLTFAGDVRAELARGDRVAVAASPGSVEFTPLDPAGRADAGPATGQVSGTFLLRPLWAVLAPHVVAISLVLVGFSLLPQRPWQVALLLAVCALAGAALGIHAAFGSAAALLATGVLFAPSALLGFGLVAAVVVVAPGLRVR